MLSEKQTENKYGILITSKRLVVSDYLAKPFIVPLEKIVKGAKARNPDLPTVEAWSKSPRAIFLTGLWLFATVLPFQY